MIIIKNLVKIILNYFRRRKVKFKKVKLIGNQKFNGSPYIYISKGEIIINDGVTINSGLRHNPIGGQTKMMLIAQRGGKIIIGSNTGISNSSIVSHKKIEIGENVLIGGSCTIWDTDFHSLNTYDRNNPDQIATEDIKIENNVFIGGKCTILKGVKIGENSIVGAGSVVTKSIPKNQIWAGNPAKFIRKI